MIRNLLATTAIATLLASGAYAQDTTAPAPAAEPAPMTQDAAPATATETTTTTETETAETTTAVDGYLASNMIGETVYNGTGDDAENIGEVNDIVLDAEGNIESIVIGVGGFLGIGEKSVAVEFSEVDWAERDGDRWLVIAATKEQLEQQTAFDPAPYEPVPAAVATDTTAPAVPVDPAAPATDTAEAPADPAAPATDTAEAPAVDPAAPATETAEAPAVDPAAPATETAEAPAADPAAPATDTAEAPAVDPAAPATDTAEAPAADPAAPAATETAEAPAADPAAPATDSTETAAIDRSTLTEIPMDQIRSEDLVGTTVYGAEDANVGEIGDVVLNADGKVDAVIIDVGGFLGVGEKEVAVGMDKLAFMQDDSNKRYLYTTFTKEQLEAAVAYDEATFADKRDEQLLIVQ